MVEAKDSTQGINIARHDNSGFWAENNATKSIPFYGSGETAVKDTVAVVGMLTDPKADGGDIALGVSAIATDVTGFVQSSADTIMSIATDPLGWLIGQGLNFLLTVVQPLQDAIHWVSGDGPALTKAAENFDKIAKGLNSMALDFAKVADETLSAWSGDASKAAKERLGEFANGINGISAKSGDIAQMLQISAMLMQFIEELIKAILTELVTWLLMIWIPALAAAIPTCGGSTAAAGSATGVKAASTTAKTTQKVNKLRKILDDILEWLRKLKDKLANTKVGKFLDEVGDKAAKTKKQGLSRTLYGEKGSFGSRYENAWKNPVMTDDGALNVDKSLRNNAVTETLKAGRDAVVKGLVGVDMPKTKDQPVKAVTDGVAKVTGHVKNAKKAGDYGSTGTEQTDEEIRDDLDI